MCRPFSSITCVPLGTATRDRKSTRLNSSHLGISYAVFCLKKPTSRRRSLPCLHTDRSCPPLIRCSPALVRSSLNHARQLSDVPRRSRHPWAPFFFFY